MFNSATLYYGKYGDSLVKDFKQKFPGVCDELKINCGNCPKAGENGWADIVCISGIAYYTVFSVYLAKFWANCGLATVSGLCIGGNYQKKGVCAWWLQWITKMLSEMGYTVAIGTTNPSQTAIHPKLIKAGWEEVEACNFVNRRGGNQIKFWRINLPEYIGLGAIHQHQGPLV